MQAAGCRQQGAGGRVRAASKGEAVPVAGGAVAACGRRLGLREVEQVEEKRGGVAGVGGSGSGDRKQRPDETLSFCVVAGAGL